MWSGYIEPDPMRRGIRKAERRQSCFNVVKSNSLRNARVDKMVNIYKALFVWCAENGSPVFPVLLGITFEEGICRDDVVVCGGMSMCVGVRM